MILKVVFDDATKEREELLSNQKNNENKNKIVKVDLRIAMCVKKRARLTKGGYSFFISRLTLLGLQQTSQSIISWYSPSWKSRYSEKLSKHVKQVISTFIID